MSDYQAPIIHFHPNYTLPAVVDTEDATPKKPQRRLTAYHIFFQIEREYIIQTMDGDIADQSTMENKTIHDDVPQRYKNIKLLPEWYRVPPGKRKKRKHRTTHGKIGFLELSKIISSRWAELEKVDPETKSFVQKIAKAETAEYYKEMDQYKELIKDIPPSVLPPKKTNKKRTVLPSKKINKKHKTVIASGETCPEDYATSLFAEKYTKKCNDGQRKQLLQNLPPFLVRNGINLQQTENNQIDHQIEKQMMMGVVTGNTSLDPNCDVLLDPQLARQLNDVAKEYNINYLKRKRESEQRANQQQVINGVSAYEVLGITEDSTVDDIKAAYCAQALVHNHFRASDECKDEGKNKMDMIHEAFSTAMNNKAPHPSRFGDACPGSEVQFATERNSTDNSLHLSIGTILPCFNKCGISSWRKCNICYNREEGVFQMSIGYQLARSLITIGYPFIVNNNMRYGEEISKCEADMHFMYDERSCVAEQDGNAHLGYKTKKELDGLTDRVEFVVENGGKYGLILRNNCRRDVMQDHLQVILIDALIREWKKGVDMGYSFVDKPIIVFIDYIDEDDYPHNLIRGGKTSKHLTAARGKYGERVFSVHCRDQSNTTNNTRLKQMAFDVSRNKLGEEIPDFVEKALVKIFPWCRGEGLKCRIKV